MTSLDHEDRRLISDALDYVNWPGVRDPLELAVEAIVRRRVTEALTEAADAVEVERRHLDRSDRISFATGCYRAERIVRARIPN